MEPQLFGIFVLFAIGMGFSLWALFAPDAWMRVDRVTWGWMFRGGNDVELSDSGRAWIRVRGVIGILATLFACGMLLSLRAESIARVEAAETEQARQDYLNEVADAWGASRDLWLEVPSGGAVSDSILPNEIAPTIVGYAPVTDGGAKPEYLRELWMTRGFSNFPSDREKEDVYARTDLVIGSTSVCDVSTVIVTSEADRVVLDVQYAVTAPFRGDPLTCTPWSIGRVDLIAIELPEPLGDRSVELIDGTVLTEVRTP